ncbi:hypothetical protein ABAC460_05260 [Asticcacaulis sp. AC460]|uniref:MarR family winged helix-turn-helix transcriptional regulator n=1 Tax=Asticcacaulis sp. AC460 TaxID=1282360 RepID=UPI0003C408BC|nr:MarR family transcriptional regulator [Asticcacaulis sp. AC460]ESQ91749.1 hypothetical protein ABAC460_05260 [Asticcacaulis sp. AC460]
MHDPVEIAARFQNIATRLLRQARVLDEGSSITSAQYSTLSTLFSHPGLPLTELAAFEMVSHPTMSRTVSALIKQGLIVSAKDSQDRRAVRLSLSEAGKVAYQQVYAKRLAIIGAVLKRLKPETVADLLDNFEQLMGKPDS